MASYTPNLNLIKPADADRYDVANDNGNMDKIDAAYGTLNSKVTAINLKTVVLPWGTYGENIYQLSNPVSVGKTVKIQLGANGRYVQYFTIPAWGDSEQVSIMTDTGMVLVSFTDSTHINVRGAALTNNPLKIVYMLDGLVL